MEITWINSEVREIPNHGIIQPNETRDLPDDLAKSLIAQGDAMKGKPKKEKAKDSDD